MIRTLLCFQQDTSTSVEILHLSANETFGKFKGKHLSSDKVDFSDRLRPSDKKKGYISWSGDFELAARGETETPLQKYQRLNCEVRELVEELEEAKKAKETNEGELAKVAMRVSGLQEELVSLKLEEVLGSEAIKSMQDPGSATAEKLLAHLERLKLGSSSSKDGSKNSQAETKKTEAAAKLDAKEITAKFDKRLEALEKALGANPEAMVRSYSQTMNLIIKFFLIHSLLWPWRRLRRAWLAPFQSSVLELHFWSLQSWTTLRVVWQRCNPR